MIKYRKHSLTFILVFCVTIFIGTVDSTTGAEEGLNQSAIATAAVEGGRIEWHIELNTFGTLNLSVQGPEGFKFYREFQPGSTPYFQMLDGNGNRFPDGLCTYELRLNPSPLRDESPENLPNGRPENKSPVLANDFEQVLTQSGSFEIKGGRIFMEETTMEMEKSLREELQPGPSKPDYCINDDAVIDGSLCVGNDCTCPYPSFGFDTIVLAENNLRILFDDTSSISNYSRNDWRITINSSIDGGASFFSIDDATGGTSIFKLEAGAPSNSLYVDSHGDVGINTSTPYYELHIVDGDTPTVRLEQDGSYGWTPQKWDLSSNETNFFIRDATHGSKLPFRIEPDAPTNAIFVKSTGMVGIGTGAPLAKLHVQSTTGATDPMLLVERLVSGTQKAFLTVKDNGDVELLKTSGQGSDRNQKKNIKPIDTALILESVAKLPLFKWNYKSDDDSIVHMGPMAQDFYSSFGLGSDDKHITPIDSSGVAFAAVQELYKLVAKQNEMIRELQKRNARLESRLKDE